MRHGCKVEARKRPVNLTLNEDLVQQAQGMTDNHSEVVESLLADFVAQEQRHGLARAKALETTIGVWNDFNAKVGSFSDEYSSLCWPGSMCIGMQASTGTRFLSLSLCNPLPSTTTAAESSFHWYGSRRLANCVTRASIQLSRFGERLLSCTRLKLSRCHLNSSANLWSREARKVGKSLRRWTSFHPEGGSSEGIAGWTLHCQATQYGSSTSWSQVQLSRTSPTQDSSARSSPIPPTRTAASSMRRRGFFRPPWGVTFLVPHFRAVARWSTIALLGLTLPAAVEQVTRFAES